MKIPAFVSRFEFWLSVIAIILTIIQLASSWGTEDRFDEIFSRLADYEEAQVPLEIIVPPVPSTKHHSLNETLEINLPIEYSGKKFAMYTVSWSSNNEQDSNDDVTMLSNDEDESTVLKISESDGKVDLTKQFEFSKVGTYELKATIDYIVISEGMEEVSESTLKKELSDEKDNNTKHTGIMFNVIVE